jgi:hypothetical protein
LPTRLLVRLPPAPGPVSARRSRLAPSGRGVRIASARNRALAVILQPLHEALRSSFLRRRGAAPCRRVLCYEARLAALRLKHPKQLRAIDQDFWPSSFFVTDSWPRFDARQRLDFDLPTCSAASRRLSIVIAWCLTDRRARRCMILVDSRPSVCRPRESASSC